MCAVKERGEGIPNKLADQISVSFGCSGNHRNESEVFKVGSGAWQYCVNKELGNKESVHHMWWRSPLRRNLVSLSFWCFCGLWLLSVLPTHRNQTGLKPTQTPEYHFFFSPSNPLTSLLNLCACAFSRSFQSHSLFLSQGCFLLLWQHVPPPFHRITELQELEGLLELDDLGIIKSNPPLSRFLTIHCRFLSLSTQTFAECFSGLQIKAKFLDTELPTECPHFQLISSQAHPSNTLILSPRRVQL